MIQTFDQALSNTGIYGNRQDKILIQERINGIEYVVNTVSCNGIHRVTS